MDQCHSKFIPYLNQENGRECHNHVDDGDTEGDVRPEIWKRLRQDVIAVVEDYDKQLLLIRVHSMRIVHTPALTPEMSRCEHQSRRRMCVL